MENKVSTKELLFVAIVFIFWICFLIIKTNNLNKRIEEIEQRNKEVHEYILNRIGG